MSQNVLFTCDLCPKAVFHSREALVCHVDEKHGDFVEDRQELQSMAEMIRPMHHALSEKLSAKWADVGSRTFDISSSRDAGQQRLQQACEARAQLELVARQWRRGQPLP